MKVVSISDLHLRSTVPGCVDCTSTEWMEIQHKALWKVVYYAVSKQVQAVLIGGDIFHSENTTSFECIIMFQQFVQELHNHNIETYIMSGNHDLPQHSSQNITKAAIGTVYNSMFVYDMKDCSFCSGSNFDEETDCNSEIIFKHVLTMPSEIKPPFIDCETPETLLAKYSKAQIILTGDYHRAFSFVKDNRCVLNSGCLTKQAADFEDYETGCWLVEWFYDDNNRVNLDGFEWLPIDVEQRFYKNAEKKEIDKSVEEFAMSIQKQEVTLDYISSLQNEIKHHDTNIQEKVSDWIQQINQ